MTRLAKAKAAQKAELKEDPALYEQALHNQHRHLHKLAVQQYLTQNPEELKAALADKTDPHHKAAKALVKQHKAKVYLSSKTHLAEALKDKHNKYHKQAVSSYLSNEKHYKTALKDKHSPFHKAALRLRKEEHERKKHAHKHRHSKHHSESEPSTTPTPTGTKSDTESTPAVEPSPTPKTLTSKVEPRWD